MRAKRALPAQSQAVNKSAPTAKIAAKKKKARESEEDDEFVEPIDVVKTKIGKKRGFPESINAGSQPTRKVRKLDNGESEVEEVQSTKPVKKPAKKPTVFKLGKWNPETVLISDKEALEMNATSDTLNLQCCTRCNSRNVVRAVNTNNLRLLKQALSDKKNIANVLAPWSIECQHLNIISMIVERENIPMLEALLKLNVKGG